MRLFLIFSALFLSLAAPAQRIDLRLLSDLWPPFTAPEGQQAIALALVGEALQRGGIAAQFTVAESVNILQEVSQGSYDGSAALWPSAEREAQLIYSEPYLENRLILVGPKGSDVSAQSLQELAGKRVALVENYAYGNEVDEAEGVEFVLGASQQDNLLRMLRGEVDYMLVDALLTSYLLQNQSEEADRYLAVGKHPMTRRTLHFVVRRDVQGAEYYIERFNRQIKDMVADGSFQQILRLNWIQTDIDGDGREELVLSGQRAGERPPASSYDLMVGGSPDSAGQALSVDTRYYIDGQVYENWEAVPAKYKVPEVTEEDLNRPGLRLFEFRF